MIVEACVESFQEAIKAESNGADRIELCAQLEIGGTTPSYALIESTYKILKIPIMVMIRPRGGHFVYSTSEIKIMKQSIDICKSIGVYGIVFGILTNANEVDITKTKDLVKYAHPLQITFHKAIDDTPHILEAVEQLKNIDGVNRILTSGGCETAFEGAIVINKMVDLAKEKLIIVAAGRITNENLKSIKNKLSTSEFHGRKIVGHF